MNFRDSFDKLASYVEDNNYRGYDPYDGLNSPIIQNTFLGKSRFFRLVWIQLFKRNPINFRSLVGIKKEENPKGLGLFLIGYCNLYERDQNSKYLDKINYLVKRIIDLQSPGYSGACWGYNFDWQARAFFQPKGTPTVVATSFIVYALFKAYEITKNLECYTVAVSGASFVLTDLQRTYDEDGDFSFSYSPLDSTQVYNASLLGARLLAQVYSYTGGENLLLEAEKAINYAVKAQKNDGSWSYGTLHFHKWVDNFHTGYNLECIHEFQKFSGTTKFQQSIDKGIAYYLNNFFTEDGISKYYNNKTYPVDIHAPAQLVVTLSKLGVINQHQDMVKRVLAWTINNMQSKEGFFYYQLKKVFTSKVPYIRWAQAWMFYSLTYFLNEVNE
jgi:hypothetical protein